ncbi:MAG: ABC transporter ATP-binding protein [Steroidobacteraceae bacterium]
MTEPVLNVRNLTVNYGAKRVLTDITLSILTGEWFTLLGPNGSGKTTLLRCVSGQIAPAAGNVRIGGHSVIEAPERAKRLLGCAHPPEALPGLLTGRQCLEVYAAAHELPSVGGDILDLAVELRLASALDQWVNTYSLGMRQKLSILLALIGNPALIVLDEAFNGLDPASALTVKHVLQERVAHRRSAVLVATHALDLVLRYGTRAVLLLDGAVVKSWSTEELDTMRADEPGAFESALASAVSTSAGER